MKYLKRYDPTRDPAATDFLPVVRAAARFHDRLFPGSTVKAAETLDALAQALGTALAMYLRNPETGELRTLDKAVIARGRFSGGAMRIEFEDGGTPLRNILVSRKELDPAIEALAADPEALQACRPPQLAGSPAGAFKPA